MNKIIIIGGGAAGLMAAVGAAQSGSNVTVIEKMPSVGRKLLITGKGRCNLTNIADIAVFIKNMPGNGSFLYSVVNAFTKDDVISFFETQGVATKVERGGRVFPESDQAIDIVNAFKKALRELGVRIITGKSVKEILTENDRITGVLMTDGSRQLSDGVILATGGASYPTTGSSGDGYAIASKLGHTIIPLKPSLVPLEVAEEWIGQLQGLSLKNVTAAVLHEGQIVAEEFGEMIFTHYGISGPIILSLSNIVAKFLESKPAIDVVVQINLKPALSLEILDKRLQRDFEKFSRKQLKNALNELIPAKLIPIIIDLAYLDPEKMVHQVTKAERLRLLKILQKMPFTITKTRPLSEAIVTQGGVNVKEINPSTMQSKLWRGLFFAGEVIDIDGYTGGFNLQAAFSTGYIAGINSAVASIQ